MFTIAYAIAERASMRNVIPKKKLPLAWIDTLKRLASSLARHWGPRERCCAGELNSHRRFAAA